MITWRQEAVYTILITFVTVQKAYWSFNLKIVHAYTTTINKHMAPRWYNNRNDTAQNQGEISCGITKRIIPARRSGEGGSLLTLMSPFLHSCI